MSLRPFNPVRLRMVVFDFDGVLVESADMKTQAFETLFRDYPDHLDQIRQYHLDNEGISRYQKFQWIYDECLGIPLAKEDAERLGQRFSELVVAGILSAPMVAGAKELLDFLASLGIPMAVASGTPQDELEWIIAERGLSDYFAEVHGSPKSKDQSIRELIECWDIKADEVLTIGDAASDYRAAQVAGTQFFARERQGSATPWRGTNALFGNDLYDALDVLKDIKFD